MKNGLTNKKWSIHGKYVLITGATSGIGLAAAKELSVRGAKLGIVARNQNKANAVVEQIKALVGNDATVDLFMADMASQQSIRQVAADIYKRCEKVDVLINNAGAMFQNWIMTEDGMEMTWAVNHLAPFLLTNLLLDKLKESESARIITTASHGHKTAKKGIHFEDMTAKKFYRGINKLFGGPTFHYQETKLANILFTAELARRIEGTGITAYCYDPGLVATNFNQHNGVLARATMAVMNLFARTPEKGAETMVWLADSPEVADQNGLYYADKHIETPTVVAQDKEMARKLWLVSEELVQLV